MEITGKIIQVLPEQSGVSKAGNPWKKRGYVLETIEQYPRKVFFIFFGDRADQYPLKEGDVKTISFDLESREYNERWYTDVRAWKAEDPKPENTSGASAPTPTAAPANVVADSVPAPAAPATPIDIPESSDDLPF